MVEGDIAGEALGEVDLDVESLDMVACRAYSIAVDHYQKEVAVEAGMVKGGTHRVEVALVIHASGEVASSEIQTLRDIVGLLHLPMHPMVIHEVIQVICVHHLEEAR